MHVAAALLGAIVAGQVAGADRPATPPSPPPGQLVDVGGWRLHLHCTGESTPSQPTVILEAGVGDFSVEWSLVQPRVAKIRARLLVRSCRRWLERARTESAHDAAGCL